MSKFNAVVEGVYTELTGKEIPPESQLPNATVVGSVDPLALIEAIGNLIKGLIDKCGEYDFPFREDGSPVTSETPRQRAERAADDFLRKAKLASRPILGLWWRVGLVSRAEEQLVLKGIEETEEVNRDTLANSTLRFAQDHNRPTIVDAFEEMFQPRNRWW